MKIWTPPETHSLPTLRNLFDKMLLFEATALELQKDLRDVHKRLDLLLDARATTVDAHPQFQETFVSNTSSPFSLSGETPSGLRGSTICNIAPNQESLFRMSTISQRLSPLTAPMDRPVQLSTPRRNPTAPLMITNGQTSVENIQNRMLPSISVPPATLVNGCCDVCANPHSSGAPTCTCSTGSLDILLHVTENGMHGRGRPNSPQAVSNFRRNSSGVCRIVHCLNLISNPAFQGGFLGGYHTPYGGGPMITKWEQLNLPIELLQSLAAFGYV